MTRTEYYSDRSNRSFCDSLKDILTFMQILDNKNLSIEFKIELNKIKDEIDGLERQLPDILQGSFVYRVLFTDAILKRKNDLKSFCYNIKKLFYIIRYLYRLYQLEVIKLPENKKDCLDTSTRIEEILKGLLVETYDKVNEGYYPDNIQFLMIFKNRFRRFPIQQILGNHCWFCSEKTSPTKFNGAYTYHHVNPSTKSEELTRLWKTANVKKIITELKKCTQLCSSCHADYNSRKISDDEMMNCYEVNQFRFDLLDKFNPKTDSILYNYNTQGLEFRKISI